MHLENECLKVQSSVLQTKQNPLWRFDTVTER